MRQTAAGEEPWAPRPPGQLPDERPRSTQQSIAEARQHTADGLVLALLETLSGDHRRVLLECHFRGASVAEAANTLGVTPGTVKSLTHHALHALRQEADVRARGMPTSDRRRFIGSDASRPQER